MSTLLQQASMQIQGSNQKLFNTKEFISQCNRIIKSIAFKNNIKISINSSQQYQVRLLILLSQILPSFSSILSIKINTKTLLVLAEAYFISNVNQQIVSLSTNSLRIVCIKAINKGIKFLSNGHFFINIKSGELKYRFSTIRIKMIEESILLNQFETMINFFISDMYHQRSNLALILYLANLNTFSMPDNNIRIGYLRSLWKILGLFNVTPTFELTEGSAGYNLILKQFQRQQLEIKEIMSRIETQFLSIMCQPFSVPSVSKYLQANDLRLTILQRKRLREMVLMPVVGRSIETDNIYITNEIKIKMPLSTVIKIPVAGSFGDLYAIKITFEIINEQDGQNGQQFQNTLDQKNKLITKTVVWKKSNNRSGSLQRIQHQLKIVKKLKNASSAFLPKYYITNGKEFQDSILLDFYKGFTLLEYMTVNKNTLSLWTKIHLVYNIAQGLRYLKRYNIVHLDIKPNNLIVTKWLMVKIIDFGQSYHPQVCSSTFYPGFTYPYVSPQIYMQKGNIIFNEKQDVYALGIILYEILFQHYPFKVTRKRFKQACLKGQLHLVTEMIPQQTIYLGQESIVLVLVQVIMRCLNQNPQLRPYIDWIALILRECISYYRDC